MHHAGIEARLGGPQRLVGGVGDAVPLVETLVGGEAAVDVAEVPLPEMPGGVALSRGDLGDRLLPLHQPVGAAGQRDAVGARPDRVPARS